MIEQLNIERSAPVRQWEEDKRPVEEKGVRPPAHTPAKFEDIRLEYDARQKSYAIRQSS